MIAGPAIGLSWGAVCPPDFQVWGRALPGGGRGEWGDAGFGRGVRSSLYLLLWVPGPRQGHRSVRWACGSSDALPAAVIFALSTRCLFEGTVTSRALPRRAGGHPPSGFPMGPGPPAQQPRPGAFLEKVRVLLTRAKEKALELKALLRMQTGGPV